jgi:two-component system, LuxR family, response regulator FixJ
MPLIGTVIAVPRRGISGMTLRPTSDLFVLDDDASMRDALSLAFTLVGYRVGLFAEPEPFLDAARDAVPAAVLLDLHMPRMSGLAVLEELDAAHYPAPIFMVTGDDTIAHAVEAMKHGAYDYVLKPLDMRALVARVGNAAANFPRHRARLADAGSGFSGRALLTPREREVLAQLAAGASNKEAGRALGISPRTIEAHRAHIMVKIGARNAADLVRIALGGSPAAKGAAARPGMVA